MTEPDKQQQPPLPGEDLLPRTVRMIRDRNLFVSIVAVGLCLGAVFVFEQVAGPDRSLAPLAYLFLLCLPALPVSHFLVRRAIRVLNETPEQHNLQRVAIAVYRLPRNLAAIHLVTWLFVGLGVLSVFLVVVRFRPDRVFMMFLACVLAGLGACLVALVRMPLILSPLQVALARQLPVTAMRSIKRTPLKTKITLVLGGVVFFSSAFGLFSSFALQREIVTYYVEQQAAEVERAVRLETHTAAPPGRACRRLEKLTPVGGLLAYARNTTSCRFGIELPQGKADKLLGAPAGSLSVPTANLEGVKYDADGAALVVLFPKPEWARRVLSVSLIFYTLLFLFSGYLAAQIARDLTSPINELRRQVKAIEGGDLSLPVAPTSADEIGDLSGAVEAMRLGLKEMVETIRSLNLTLEEKVRLRTDELERANTDLVSTLTQLKQTQTQLVHAEKMASLGRLMSGLAHELNNPVNAIRNSAGPLARGIAGLTDRLDERTLERLSRAAKVVESGATRTMDLIASMSAFSRHDEQVMKPTDINAAVEATLMLLQHRVDGADTSVRFYQGDLPRVVCNPGEINQVIMNLLANALEAVESQGGSGFIEVATRQVEGEVHIVVADNGPGLAEDVATRVYEPFFTTKDSGTGLGLAISYQIVDRHNGTIELGSELGTGCRFTVRLPLSD